MEIKLCKKCGFIMGQRPCTKDDGEICLACRNIENKGKIDWETRQKWLTEHIKEKHNSESNWDVIVGVSGGKDSYAIVRRLIENHQLSDNRILLVNIEDEFTTSGAGAYNLDNLVKQYNTTLMRIRLAPNEFVRHAREDFFESLNPLKWIEEKIYSLPLEIAKKFDVPMVIMGENPAFEYGESQECAIFHPSSTDDHEMIYMGAIYPYSTDDSLKCATEKGFKTLNSFKDWKRQGGGDDFSQIDSYGYMVHLWLKFIKYGFQRVSDMACRFVREGKITRDMAIQMIKDHDWKCDPLAQEDFCKTLGITNVEFCDTVDRFANKELLVKDALGNWRRRDLI